MSDADLQTVVDVRAYVEKTLDNINGLTCKWDNSEVEELMLDIVNGLARGTAAMVIVPEPVVLYPGPHDNAAQFMIDAAWKLRNGYEAGGSNVKNAIATLLENVAREIDPEAVTAYTGHPSADAQRAARRLEEGQ